MRNWRRSLMRAVLALSVLAVCTIGGVADLLLSKKYVPAKKRSNDAPLKELSSPEIVAAWKEAGAEVGWMRFDDFGWFEFHFGMNSGDDVFWPTFRFSTWNDAMIAKLPSPTAGFGLDLSFSNVTDTGMRELARFENLQALDLAKTNITGKGLSRIQSLRSLGLAATHLTGAGLREVAQLKDLQSLDLYGGVSAAGLKELATLKNLQKLNLGMGMGRSFGTPSGLAELVHFDNLRSLVLVGLHVTDADLKHVSKLEHLNTLVLGGATLTDDGLKELTTLTNLRSLYLYYTVVTGAGLKDLQGLQTLSLRGARVTESGLKGLKSLKSLKTLDLSAFVIRPGPKEPMPLTERQMTNLPISRVTDADIENLTGLKNLQTLSLKFSDVSHEGISRLRKALPNFKIIQ